MLVILFLVLFLFIALAFVDLDFGNWFDSWFDFHWEWPEKQVYIQRDVADHPRNEILATKLEEVLAAKEAKAQPEERWMEKLNCSQEDWSRFCAAAFSDDSDWTMDFTKLSKKHGRAYMEYLRASWWTNEKLGGSLTDEEWCRTNGNVPLKFLEDKIKTDDF